MIIAAAIKYHIESTNEDVVLCGVRHGDIFVQLKALGFLATSYSFQFSINFNATSWSKIL